MVVDLTTTNVLLGILAAVSLLEAAALIGAGIFAMRMYKQLTEQIQSLEQKHLAPLTARALPLLDEAKALSVQASPLIDEAKVLMKTVQRTAERVEHSLTRMDGAVQGTIDSAEQAVDKVQGGVRKTAGTVIGVVRGVRTAIETFLTDQPDTPRAPRREDHSHTVHPDSPFVGTPGVPPSERPM
jgi:uncharacterized protein YoxC